MVRASSALFNNGGFEAGGGSLGNWTVTRFQNPGIGTFPPTSMANLTLMTATTTLNGALTAAANVVPVASIATFVAAPTTGSFQIDNEVMTYTGTAVNAPIGPRFTGVVRGAFGTMAAAHNSGAAVNAPFNTFARTGATQSKVFSGMGAGPPFYPEFDAATAVINESPIGFDHNANSLKQAFATTFADVDPTDNKVHVRFALAPALQNPGHADNQQPYFYVEVRNTTKGTQLYHNFNFSNQPGIPWKIDTSGATPVAYTDWQIFDIAPGNGALPPGDTVEVEVIAAGCSPSGHWGEVYLDGFGSDLPGLSIRKTAPQAANLDTDVTYTFTVKNSTSGSQNNVVADEVLPRNSTFKSINPGTGVCMTPAVGAAGTVSCSFGWLNPGETRNFQVTVHQSAPSTSGTASAVGANTLTDGSKAWAVNQWQGYSAYITGGQGVGQQRIVASNTANQLTAVTNWAPALNTTSTYSVLNQPAVLSTATGGANTSLTDTTQAWSVNQWTGWTVTTLTGTGAGQSLEILSNTATQLNVAANWTTNPDATTRYAINFPVGVLTNGNYGVKSDTSSRLIGPMVQTNLTSGVSYSDLSMIVTDGVAAVPSGGMVTYTITVKNNGALTVTNAVVNDAFPAGLGTINWTCAGAGGGTCTTASGAGNITNRLVTLPPGATATFTVTATVTAANGTISNTATVAMPGGVTDNDSSNNSDTDIDTVGPLFALTVTKGAMDTGIGTVTSAPAAISCGASCSGNFASGTNVTLTAVARTGDTFVGWGGACAAAGASPTCTVSMNAAISVTASFRGPSVTGVSSGNGTISCMPSPVSQGSSSTCTITPGAGYQIENVTDNGTNVTASASGGSYTLTNLTADHAVNVSFDQIPVITSTASPTNVKTGTAYSYAAAATDGDGPAPLVWSKGAGDTCGGVVSATGVYSFTAGAAVTTCVMSVTVCDSASVPACATQKTTLTIYQCMSAAECNDNNACTTDTCSALTCMHANLMAGTACDDGNNNTKNDVCNGMGGCAGTPYTCVPTQCQASSTPNGVGCTVVNKANGAACTDGNGCTLNDNCQSGNCQSGAPVVCANPTKPVCDPSSGVCGCTMSGQCSGATPVCDTTAKTCVRCLTAGDCPMGASCNAALCVLPPPVVVTPANGSLTNKTKPPISGTSVPNATVTIFIDGMSFGSVTADGAGNWTFTPASALGFSSHTVSATASAGAGVLQVTSAMSNTNTFTIINGCLADADCLSSTAAFCDLPTHTCVGCNGDNGSAATRACPTTANPYCAASGGCGKCSANTDCTGHPAGLICNITTGACGTTCALDTDCANTEWCNAGVCTPRTPNGQPVPSAPPINGTCTAANGLRVCLSGACDTSNDTCGLTNGKVCGPPPSDPVCQSDICFVADDRCGLPNDQSCASVAVCRSAICYTDQKCGLPNGQPCATSGVCRSLCYAPDGLCGLPNGVPCGSAAECRSAVCNADGKCGDPDGSPCSGPTTCRSGICAGSTCGSTCNVDTDCPPADWCDMTVHTCKPGQPNGAPCARVRQCTSAVCFTDGKCGEPDGQPCGSPAVCRSDLCNASNQCGTGGCTADPQCAPQDFCDGVTMTCKPDLPNSMPCSRAAQCLSAVCFADGKCGEPDGQPCSSAIVCRNGVCDANHTCGSGGCTADDQCLAGNYCELASGTCKPQQPNGQPCAAADQCLSAVCFSDGKCGEPNGQPCGSGVVCRSTMCGTGGTCIACSDDSQCGTVTSGVVCNAGVCAPGCRGSGGNGCQVGQSCTSSDATVGTCFVPDMAAPPDLGADTPDLAMPSPQQPMPDTADVGFAGGGFCTVGGHLTGGAWLLILLLAALSRLIFRSRAR